MKAINPPPSGVEVGVGISVGVEVNAAVGCDVAVFVIVGALVCVEVTTMSAVERGRVAATNIMASKMIPLETKTHVWRCLGFGETSSANFVFCVPSLLVF